jgi:hypothetical protein
MAGKDVNIRKLNDNLIDKRKNTGKWDREMAMQVLEKVFKLGCSVPKAALYTGIPERTIYDWLESDDVLRSQVRLWQNYSNWKARENWLDKLEKKHYTASKEWLERKEKDEFSKKEITSNEGSIEVKVVNYSADQEKEK